MLSLQLPNLGSWSWGVHCTKHIRLYVTHNMGSNLNFVVQCLHILHNLKLVLMYMYGGSLKNIHHLYRYGSVAMLNLDCDCGMCVFDTLEARILN